MAKLCYRIGSETKKYDLKDSADTPRIAIRTSSGTKYLRLKEGSKAGELNVGVPIWVSDSRMATVTHHVSTLLDPDEVTPTAAPFAFGFKHSNSNSAYYGKAVDFIAEPSASKITSGELASVGGDTSHAVAERTTPDWFISDHEYVYLPLDNNPTPNSKPYFYNLPPQASTFCIYSHAHGGNVVVNNILIQDSKGIITKELPSVERIIHKGDKVAVEFFVNYTSGDDNPWSWVYQCRPMLRQLDVPSTSRKIPSNLNSYQAIRSAAIEAGGVVWNIDSGVMNFDSIYTSDGVKHTLRTLFRNDWVFDNDYTGEIVLPVGQFGCTLLVCDALDNIYILPEGETSIKKYSWSKTTEYTLVNTYNK